MCIRDRTMGACTHVSTSQDGINTFGVKRLGGVVCGISTFNSTQCYIHGWFLWSIHTWMKYMDLCMWELGILDDSYVKNLGTIRDYVIWWELRLAVSISKSSVESWVGCDMFTETMGACTHVSTSQDGINAFGVKQLGGVICGISTFNSTQCLYSWMILAIYPYMDEIYGMITHLFTSYLLKKYILMIWCHMKYYMRSMLKHCCPDASFRHLESHG